MAVSHCMRLFHHISGEHSNSRTLVVMITLRVDALWDYNKRITYMMLGGFAVTYSVTVVLLVLAIIDFRSVYDSILSTCH